MKPPPLWLWALIAFTEKTGDGKGDQEEEEEEREEEEDEEEEDDDVNDDEDDDDLFGCEDVSTYFLHRRNRCQQFCSEWKYFCEEF